MTVDVVVVGSGAGALVAATAAAAAGLDVTVVEKSSQLGGGSALSTGLVFAPANDHMAEAGFNDTPEEALAYLAVLNAGVSPGEALRDFIGSELEMLRWLETETPLRLRAIPHLPDFHPEFDGGKDGGRHLAAEPFDGGLLGEWADRTRRSQSLPLTYYEIEEMGGPAKVREWNFELIAERVLADIRAQGAALVAPLVADCLRRGVAIRTDTAVGRLVVDGEGVRGVDIDTPDGGVERIDARRGVVLATGGFEWSESMNREFLGAPLAGPLTVPTNEGDGHRMAQRLGAGVALMQESVWSPVLHVPGEEYEGRPYWRNLASEKGRPHSILVNSAGRRFVNENLNYVDLGRSLAAFDPTSYAFPNLHAWLVFDSAYKSTYPVATAMPGEGAPAWICEAGSLADLAAALGIDGKELERTVHRFNAFAADGRDEDFGRGETTFERYYGDPANAGRNPTLGALDEPPYYAVPVELGTFGNRGGLVTTDTGQVLTVDGTKIQRLFACGNARAQTTLGRGYEGGGTLAQAMTFGFRAARAIANGGA